MRRTVGCIVPTSSRGEVRIWRSPVPIPHVSGSRSRREITRAAYALNDPAAIVD